MNNQYEVTYRVDTHINNCIIKGPLQIVIMLVPNVVTKEKLEQTIKMWLGKTDVVVTNFKEVR